MNILLTIPFNRSYVVMPSLGLGYLAAILCKLGHNVVILNCIKENFSLGNFKNYIFTQNFDLVCFQMFSYDLNIIKEYLEIIKLKIPSPVVIIGGPHPSGDPFGVLNDLGKVDFAFQGEAEIGLQKLVEILNNVKDLSDSDIDDMIFSSIPGLIWKNKGEIIVNKPGFVDDLDSLDFPAWNLQNPRSFPYAPHGAFARSFPTAPLIITRGCPYTCTFCAGKSISGRKIRKRSIKNVIDEIKYLKNKYEVKEIMIEDECFTAHKNLVKEFCESLLSENLKISWSLPSGVRIDTLDKELLTIMEKAGCYSLAVGIEFGSQRILDLTKKHLNLEIIKEKIELFKNINIKVTGFFMMGVPGEKKEDIRKTINIALELPLNRAQFNNFMPLPGSELWDELKSKGELNTINWDKFFVHDVAFTPDGITEKEMKLLQREAYLRFYLRPSILFGIFKEIKSFSHVFYLLNRFFDAMK